MYMQTIIQGYISLQLLVTVNSVPAQDIKILKYENESANDDGSYKWSYETDNGIAAQEQAHLKSSGTLGVQGSYDYTAPGGMPVSIIYIADENGFQVQGNVLPEPPPIPKWILKALAWNAAHPEEEEQEKRLRGRTKNR